MNERASVLAERRAALIARVANQRNEMARAAGPLRAACSAADRGMAMAGYLKQRPLLLAGGIAALVLLRPAFLWKWLKRGLLAWRLSLSIKRMLSNQQSPKPAA